MKRCGAMAGLVLALCATGAMAADRCTQGRRQSPVDITATSHRALPALQFDYRAAPLKLVDDGHTVRVRFGPGSTLGIGGERYGLRQFHFHTPAGDKVAGEAFPMAAHLLHKGPSGQLLVVVVLFRTGSAAHPLLAELLPRLPARGAGDQAVPGVAVDASALLPTQRSYYRYTGSETAPPCSEGVEWIVLKQPVSLSPAQLAQYRQRFADNARAVQPLNGRVVWESD